MLGVQGDFFASATENGGTGLLLKVLTDTTCMLLIEEVAVSALAMSNFGTMISELRALGYNQYDRKYLIWADTNVYCGIANLLPDDTKGLSNRNNSAVNYARVDTPCWGKAETHEVAHTLGAVQLSAQHSTGGYHCYDEYDHMCYRDGGSFFANGGQLEYRCPDSLSVRLDCGHDDYYDATGSHPYFANHFNLATDSRFLVAARDAVTVSTTTSSSTTSSTTMPLTSSTTAPTTTSTTTSSTTSTVASTTTTTTVEPTTTTTTRLCYLFLFC